MLKTDSYLMSFERMIQLLQESGAEVGASRIMGLQTTPSRLICNGRPVILSNDLFEKLVGTWWEVEAFRQRQAPSRCLYLADSFQDALRLRPEIDTTYCYSYSTTEDDPDFMVEITRWVEDECFID